MPGGPLPLVVVKVGGSLFDHPALGDGLRRWCAGREGVRLLLVPGGGPMADVIRGYHRTHGASEEACHWMAIRTMGINADLLRSLLPDSAEVCHPAEWPGAIRVGVLSADRFCRDDEGRDGALPHSWRVTSDSIAARAAEVSRGSIVLLKSADLPARVSWSEAAGMGLVDSMFADVVRRASVGVEWVNFRRLLDQINARAKSI